MTNFMICSYAILIPFCCLAAWINASANEWSMFVVSLICIAINCFYLFVIWMPRWREERARARRNRTL